MTDRREIDALVETEQARFTQRFRLPEDANIRPIPDAEPTYKYFTYQHAIHKRVTESLSDYSVMLGRDEKLTEHSELLADAGERVFFNAYMLDKGKVGVANLQRSAYDKIQLMVGVHSLTKAQRKLLLAMSATNYKTHRVSCRHAKVPVTTTLPNHMLQSIYTTSWLSSHPGQSWGLSPFGLTVKEALLGLRFGKWAMIGLNQIRRSPQS